MKKTTVALVLLLLMSACLLQWGLDRTPAGTAAAEREYFPSAASLLDMLGGVRQYLAYVLYIKTDMLHHTYYGALGQEAEMVPYYILISFLDPHYESAYYVGAAEIYMQGRKEEAIEYALRGVKANPESADLYYNLADLYLEEKRYEEARQAYEQALEYEPKIVNRNYIFNGIAATCKALGDLEAQRKVLIEQAIYNRIVLYRADLNDAEREFAVRTINDALQVANPAPR